MARTKAKLVVLQGSPRRKGNTAALAREVIRGARAAGAEVTEFFLQDMKIAGCIACGGCRRKGARGCVIKDDMQVIYPVARAADAVLFASPIYWFTVSAQLKACMDRFYAFGGTGPHKLAGKRIGLCFTFEGDDAFDSGCINAIRTFQDAFAFIRAPIVGMAYGRAHVPADITGNRELVKQAHALGAQLAGR